MATLIADRFLCDAGIVDLATGEFVDLRIEHAGTRADQQLWSEACARALDDRRAPLIDFGFIGRDRRFEARRLTPPPEGRRHRRWRSTMRSSGSTRQAKPRRGFSIEQARLMTSFDSPEKSACADPSHSGCRFCRIAASSVRWLPPWLAGQLCYFNRTRLNRNCRWRS
ncbi:MAG: hypothetical protein EXQ55_04425 [Acidobacteria bacterium]|nr:hypothetical protein [Acidobacteriota bacterium]